jgi:hypothetical protein
MSLKSGTKPTERGQFTHGEIASSGQDTIEQRTHVTVGEEKHILFPAVYAELLWVDLHLIKIEGCDDVGGTQRTTGMSGLAAVNHSDDVTSHLRSHSFQFVGIHVIINCFVLFIPFANLLEKMGFQKEITKKGAMLIAPFLHFS